MRFLILFFGYVNCVLGSQDTGSPAGLMADCPGMTRNTTFSEKTLKSLYVVVVKPSRSFFGTGEARCAINARGAKCAAKHLNLRKGVTQVLISGYMDASFSPLVRSLASIYLAKGRNVVIVEIFPILVRTYPVVPYFKRKIGTPIGSLCWPSVYPLFSERRGHIELKFTSYRAARSTKPLGHVLGEFMAGLTELGLSPDRLELVGGSLGAHIAYFASVKYRQLTGSKPARLSGLDPAGPCFRNLPDEERLNAGAAERVDVTHTNIDGFGIADRMGHVDFYVNGGEYQSARLSDFILPCFQLCSHVRSAIYWMLSYSNPNKFAAVRCDSIADARLGNCYAEPLQTNYLGPNTNFSQPGIYYLPTSEIVPYFMGEEGLKKRKYDHNDYLLKPAPDVDMVI